MSFLSSLLFLWLNFYPFHQQQGGYFHRWFSSQGEFKCTGYSWFLVHGRGENADGCAMKTVYSVSRLRHIALLTAAGTDGGNCWVRRFVWHHGYGSQPPLLSLGGVVRVTATRSAPPRNLSHQNSHITGHYGPRGPGWVRLGGTDQDQHHQLQWVAPQSPGDFRWDSLSSTLAI